MSAGETFPHAPLLAIAGMALMTYGMRVGGFWLMGRLTLTGRARHMLEALPGSVVAAIVLPVMASSGPAAFLAVGAVVLSMFVRRNEFIALGLGLAVAIAVRAAGL
ncbi:MAG: AzlD domain-containing protein [Pseudorhodoplanes sp.]|nr:AzlD domain-containing protein [Pseudorhodoplanes sp.]